MEISRTSIVGHSPSANSARTDRSVQRAAAPPPKDQRSTPPVDAAAVNAPRPAERTSGGEPASAALAGLDQPRPGLFPSRGDAGAPVAPLGTSSRVNQALAAYSSQQISLPQAANQPAGFDQFA